MVDTLLGELDRLESNPSLPSFMSDQIKKLQLDLRFFKVFFMCFTNLDLASSTTTTNISVQLRKSAKGLYAAALIVIQRNETDIWDKLVSNLLEKIVISKPEIAEICLNLLSDHSLTCKFSTSYDILDLITKILESLKDLVVNSKPAIVGDMMMKIEQVEYILCFFKNFVDFTCKRAIGYEKLEHFWDHVQSCTNRAASISLLFWVGESPREMKKSEIDGDLLQKIESFTPEVTEMYFGVLKASKSLEPDSSCLIGEVVASFVDFLLKDLQVSTKDGISVLGEGLMFLLTFLLDPPELSGAGGNLIWIKVDDIVNDIASYICSSSRVGQTSEQRVYKLPAEDHFRNQQSHTTSKHSWLQVLRASFSPLGGALRRLSAQNNSVWLFERRIDKVKADIKKLYMKISGSSLSDFPKTNGLGYIDFLLGKIDEMLKCDGNVKKNSFKYQFVAIQKELVTLRGFLLRLPNEHNELGDIWMEIINVAYRVEHVIDTSLIMNSPIWYHMILLSDVIQQMKLIKVGDIEEMEAKKMNIPVLTDKMKSRIDLHDKANIPIPHMVGSNDIVGFNDESCRIIDQLTGGGSFQLEIVSIVGMLGIGKTTLAKTVFNQSAIQYHFSRRVWCHVSQAHDYRKSLLNMLKSVSEPDMFISEKLTDEKLADVLYKRLRGFRFLIVLDDIWDIQVLQALRRSFPDKYNGSRILLTSQILNVALQANPSQHPCCLRPLSDEESWTLLNTKISQNNDWPQEFVKVGQRIAKNCKGLPFVIVLIAGVLAREKNLELWEAIAQSPIAFVASKGWCKEVVEPSYKHLPDVLKSCFLYFATFPKETVIKVKRLIRLWIAEGFVPKTEERSLEDVANEYLMDLISRNLVVVDNRSFSERIKECHVHDLLHSFSVTKAEEEGFSKLVNTLQLEQDGMIHKQYRLCIQPEWSPFVNSKPTGPNVHSLLFHPNNSSNKHPYSPEFFNSFQFLSVLDLEGVQCGVIFPQEVVLLTLLRFLAVAGDFTSIPSSIDNLSYLQTLYLESHESIIVLPNTIFNMKRLRHIDIPTGATISWDNRDNIVKSSCLDNLVSFSLLFISRGDVAEMLLKMLPRIRRLRFQFSNQLPVMDFLSNLESLNVQKVGRAPNSFLLKFPFTLRELSLSNLRLPWEEMHAIGKLPNLEALKLLSRSFEGLRWDMRKDQFCKLKFLKLEGLNIAEWIAEDDSLPCLQRLVVKDCIKLHSIPNNFGEKPTLNIIQGRECGSSSVAESARQHFEAQQGVGNDNNKLIVTPNVDKERRSFPLGKDISDMKEKEELYY